MEGKSQSWFYLIGSGEPTPQLSICPHLCPSVGFLLDLRRPPPPTIWQLAVVGKPPPLFGSIHPTRSTTSPRRARSVIDRLWWFLIYIPLLRALNFFLASLITVRAGICLEPRPLFPSAPLSSPHEACARPKVRTPTPISLHPAIELSQ